MKSLASGQGFLKGLFRSSKDYIKRWPTDPKIIIYGPPNSPKDLFATRLAIDIGVPEVSLESVYKKILHSKEESVKNNEFFIKIRDAVKNKDSNYLYEEKIPLKLLRLLDYAQEGFVLTDFPSTVQEAEMLEELRGGINIFAHVWMDYEDLLKIEEGKLKCGNCGELYHSEPVESKSGFIIPGHMPKDHVHCDCCGSDRLEEHQDFDRLSKDFEAYNNTKEDVLGFYDSVGLLLEFESTKGYEDYEDFRARTQINIKH